MPAAGARGAATTLGEGRAPLPDLAPRASVAWQLPVSVSTLGANELLELTVLDPRGAGICGPG